MYYIPNAPNYRVHRQLLWELVREIIAEPGREEFEVVLDRHGQSRLMRVVEGGKAAKIA